MGEEQTLGEYRVGISFNPSNNVNVDAIKRGAADLIDKCEALKRNEDGTLKDGEIVRCLAEAQTCIETAAMWAVKGATKIPQSTQA